MKKWKKPAVGLLAIAMSFGSACESAPSSYRAIPLIEVWNREDSERLANELDRCNSELIDQAILECLSVRDQICAVDEEQLACQNR